MLERSGLIHSDFAVHGHNVQWRFGVGTVDAQVGPVSARGLGVVVHKRGTVTTLAITDGKIGCDGAFAAATLTVDDENPAYTGHSNVFMICSRRCWPFLYASIPLAHVITT